MAGHTILLVEDDRRLVELMAHYLQMHGYRALIARDGMLALQLAVGKLPDLILMDLRLPKLDGLEVVRQLRQTTETEHIPIVAVTAQSSAHMREATLAAGCNDYLVKPVQLSLLMQRVESFLGHQSTPVAA